MMLCKADFEDIFPDLFGPETPTGQIGETARHSHFAGTEVHPLQAEIMNTSRPLTSPPMTSTVTR